MVNILQGGIHSRTVQSDGTPPEEQTGAADRSSRKGPVPPSGTDPYVKACDQPYMRRIAKSTICSTALASKTMRCSPSMSRTKP